MSRIDDPALPKFGMEFNIADIYYIFIRTKQIFNEYKDMRINIINVFT